jgi:hypothetical protein
MGGDSMRSTASGNARDQFLGGGDRGLVLAEEHGAVDREVEVVDDVDQVHAARRQAEPRLPASRQPVVAARTARMPDPARREGRGGSDQAKAGPRRCAHGSPHQGIVLLPTRGHGGGVARQRRSLAQPAGRSAASLQRRNHLRMACPVGSPNSTSLTNWAPRLRRASSILRVWNASSSGRWPMLSRVISG